MNPAPGLLVGGKYRLVRPLGAGGMGHVWVARHSQLDVDVALKLMAPSLAESPSAVARFEREAKAAAQLKSPHVVHIHDYGVEEGAPYIVMELLEGEDLDGLLQREGRVSLAFAAEVIGQAAKALRAAHEAGIVHRDLKPSNIFLSRASGELFVKILDFGIAKAIESSAGLEKTTGGVVLGSPLYMSPEQARGGAVGPASDLWSLSVVAFELITGAQPFLGATVGDVIAKICGDELPVPTRVAAGLPAEVDTFFARALVRDPAKRFASVRELSESFGAIAAAHPEGAIAGEVRATSPAAITLDAPAAEARLASRSPSDAAAIGRTAATAPIAIVVSTASGEGATEPEAPSPIVLESQAALLAGTGAAFRATVPAPEPAVAAPPIEATPSGGRRAVIGGVVAVVAAAAVYLALSGSTPAVTPSAPSSSAIASAPPAASSAPALSSAPPSVSAPAPTAERAVDAGVTAVTARPDVRPPPAPSGKRPPRPVTSAQAQPCPLNQFGLPDCKER